MINEVIFILFLCGGQRYIFEMMQQNRKNKQEVSTITSVNINTYFLTFVYSKRRSLRNYSQASSNLTSKYKHLLILNKLFFSMLFKQLFCHFCFSNTNLKNFFCWKYLPKFSIIFLFKFQLYFFSLKQIINCFLIISI